MNHINDDLSAVTRHLATHAKHVSAAVAQNNSSLSVISETVLKPIFQIVLNLPDLENKNELLTNFPAIDLADDQKRVCIQITSTKKASKIKKTIKKFIEDELYKKYDRLIIYILTEKQKSYTPKAIMAEVNGKFNFEINKDILDFKNLSTLIGTLQVDQIRKILDIFEANFNGGKYPVSDLDLEKYKESLFLNWLQINIPREIYMASTNASASEVRQYLKQNSSEMIVDWVIYEGKLLTFRDLNTAGNLLGSPDLIDQGTIENFMTQDFFEIDENYMRAFKNLLRRSLEQTLIPSSVIWKNSAGVFAFMPKETGESERKEEWTGKKRSKRTVYKHTTKTNKPTETLNHRHFAFSVDFIKFGNEWYMVIVPDYFISKDGYRKDYYGGNSIKSIKNRERNSHIFNHIRFITFFLKNLNSEQSSIEIRFKDLVELKGVPKFDEVDWKSRDDTPPSDDDEDVLLENL